MKETKIILNNDAETCLNTHFTIFIDGKELENVDKFTLTAKSFSGEELRKGGFLDFDDVIKYSVDYFAPYFEESK